MTKEPDDTADLDQVDEPDEVAKSDGPTVGDLERAILGEVPTLSGEEVAARAGMDIVDAGRLWRALGFPDSGSAAAFTEADADALRLVGETVTAAGIDFETVLRMTRAVGQTAARLADWEVATLGSAVPDFSGPGATSPRSRNLARELIEDVVPRFDVLLVHAWRRHLAAAVGRIAALTGEDDEDISEVTVGFADLVSFSELTNRLDDEHIGDLVEIFETRCADILARHNARLIKTLGDSVLFLCSDADTAVEIAWDIIAAIGSDERLPDVRLGLATGPVVLRMGDVYGPAVNLASRLMSVARRNRVIIDQRTAEMLSAEEFETRPIPARPMRGFGDVVPVTVRRPRGHG